MAISTLKDPPSLQTVEKSTEVEGEEGRSLEEGTDRAVEGSKVANLSVSQSQSAVLGGGIEGPKSDVVVVGLEGDSVSESNRDAMEDLGKKVSYSETVMDSLPETDRYKPEFN